MPSPLISPEALAARAGSSTVRIADVRWYLGRPGAGRAAYDAGHIPGAIFVDLDRDLAARTGPGRHPLPHPTAFARRLAALGVGDGDTVVAYDDSGGGIASRLWWMLDNLGFGDVLVLDGGLPAWTAAGLPLSSEPVTLPPATLTLADRWTRVVERDDLRDRLGSIVLLDARAGERYRGEVEPVDAYPGHIPTAFSAPTAGNLRPDGRFLPAEVLRARFEVLQCGGEAEVVTSCGSGVTACHNALAMRIAGLPDPVLYAGSYSDWAGSGLPAATGDAPGAPPPR